MSFVRKISNRILSALDFGPRSVIALMADKGPDGSLRILGGGECPARGMRSGAITHLGDAVECAVEASRKAQKAAGAGMGAVYFNFKDAAMEIRRPVGHKSLSGEGQIRASDVAQTCAIAERSVGRFDRFIAYSSQTGFLIDDRDAVANPVGVFGRKLEASLIVFLARSEAVEGWRKLIRRSGFQKGVPVLSAWSTALGVLPPEDRRGRKLILDLGEDFFSFFVFDDNRVVDYRGTAPGAGGGVFPHGAAKVLREFLGANAPADPVLVTGDLAEDEKTVRALGVLLPQPPRVVSPGLSGLAHPRFSSAAGLLSAADELETKARMTHPRRGLIGRVRRKAEAFISEYF